MDYKKLTEENLLHLIKLRLYNERYASFKKYATINKIEIVSKRENKYLGLRFVVHTDEYGEDELGMVLHKLYEDEWLYIQSVI